MRTERPRARRYQFTANIECTAVQSNLHLEERTSDLSLFGCRVSARQPLPVGTKVHVRISHAGENFIAMGKVGHVRPNEEMGIVFTHIESKDQALLDKWIAELRDNGVGQQRPSVG
jgi:hypothetical protein